MSKRCPRVWFFCESNVDQTVMHTTHTHTTKPVIIRKVLLYFSCSSIVWAQLLASPIPTWSCSHFSIIPFSETQDRAVLSPTITSLQLSRLPCFLAICTLLLYGTKSAVSHRTCELQPNSLILQHGSIDVNDSRWVTTKKVVFCVTLFSFSLQLLRLIFVKQRNLLMFKIQVAKNKLINHIQTTDFHTSSSKM